MTMRVLVREAIADAGVDLLRSTFEVDEDQATPLEEIIGRYDAIVIRSATTLTADLIDRADRLRMIGRAGVGDPVDAGLVAGALAGGIRGVGSSHASPGLGFQ